jgi:FkbM family methyltransferase
MRRRMLGAPAAVAVTGEVLREAIAGLLPDTLLKLLRWQACVDPSPRTRQLVARGKRLEFGREYRRSVLPKTGRTREIDFGDGLSLRFAADQPAAEMFMSRVLPKVGVHEPELVRYLKETVQPGDVLVDIGAHVGYVSCVAAALGAVVFAAEIQPTLIPMIQLNAALNDLWTVHPFCVEIGDRMGIATTLRVNPSPGMRGSVGEVAESEYPATSPNHDSIPRLTLDALFTGRPPPAIVKVDVEGAEGRVLAGAGQMIRAGETRFVVEVHAQQLAGFGNSLADLVAPFDPDRWTMAMLTADGREPLTREAFLDPAGPVAGHVHNAPVLFEPRG